MVDYLKEFVMYIVNQHKVYRFKLDFIWHIFILYGYSLGLKKFDFLINVILTNPTKLLLVIC